MADGMHADHTDTTVAVQPAACPEEVLAAASEELHRMWGYDDTLNPGQFTAAVRGYADHAWVRAVADHAYRAGLAADRAPVGRWELPAEPGPEVLAVRDEDGDVWTRAADGWTCSGMSITRVRPWREVLSFAPLIDVTADAAGTPATDAEPAKRSAFDLARETLLTRYGTTDPDRLRRLGADQVEIGAAEQIRKRGTVPEGGQNG